LGGRGEEEVGGLKHVHGVHGLAEAGVRGCRPKQGGVEAGQVKGQVAAEPAESGGALRRRRHGRELRLRAPEE
jgi:hypothetical protein